MSLYNMINGFNLACVVILPMLGRYPNEYPCFRDCFVTEEKDIAIYTRVGGGNRDCGFGEEELYKDPHFIRTYDDDYDPTYGYYEFSVPSKWQPDFNLIMSDKLSDVSDDYVQYVKEFYPQLAQEGVIDKIFKNISENSQ